MRRTGGASYGEREIEFADVDYHNLFTKTVMGERFLVLFVVVMGARVRQQAGVPHGAHHERIMRGEAGERDPGRRHKERTQGLPRL